MIIENLQGKHWQEVAKIYQDGIDTKNATFRVQVPTWKDWNETHHQHSRFVLLENGKVLSWCAIAPVSKRKAYKGVAEVSIYVSLKYVGNGIWTLYSSLFPKNKSSVSLHLKNDFRLIGIREKVAQQDGIWRDTVLYERRSKKYQ